MRKHFQNISLTTVFGFFLFLFAVIPVTALVINFYFLFSQNTTHDIQSRLANIEEDVYRFVQSNKVYLDEQVQTLLSSRSLLFAVNTKSESDLITIATNYLSKTSVSQIEFYDDQDEGIVSVFKKDDKIISTTLASTEKVKTYSDATLGLSYNEEPALISVREIVSDNEKIGSIKQVIAIPTTRWFELAGSQAVDVFILTKRNKLIYSSLGDLSVLDLKQLQSIDTDSLVEVSLKYNKYSLKRISDGELTIIVGANHRTYQQQLNTVTLATSITLGFVLIVLIPLLILLSRWSLSSLHHVTTAIVKLSEGENPRSLKIGFGKEVGLLTKSFNVMTEKLVEARSSLQDKIKELQSANQKIQEAQASMVQNAKMASLGQLVAGVAHELNNPIGFIHSNMDYLEKQMQDLISVIDKEGSAETEEWKESSDWDYIKKDLLKAIKACKDGASRTSVIVQDLRSFSRLDKGQKAPVYIEDLVENTLKLLKNNIDARIHIKTNLNRKKQVLCNANQINQVLVNLIMNAAQAIEGEGEIAISTSYTQDWFELRIKDSGSGISKDKQERIFEPFYTTKEVGQGTGLGLSITYTIVKEHGGNIHFISNIDEGTTFVISLPILS